jgi:hypothetical protein
VIRLGTTRAIFAHDELNELICRFSGWTSHGISGVARADVAPDYFGILAITATRAFRIEGMASDAACTDAKSNVMHTDGALSGKRRLSHHLTNALARH